MSKKKCCCAPTDWTSHCDPCPFPYEGFDLIKHEVTITASGLRNCQYGNGFVTGFAMLLGSFGWTCGCCPLSENECSVHPFKGQYTDWSNTWAQGLCSGLTVEDPCCVCLPQEIIPQTGFASGTLTVYGCVESEQLGTCSNPWIPSANPCPVDTSQNGFGYIEEDIQDYISEIKINRCRRPLFQSGNCVPFGVDCGADANGKTYSIVTVTFYTPMDVTYTSEYYCNDDPFQPAAVCEQAGPGGYGGVPLTAIYAREQRVCDWFAVGSYRLIGYVTFGCEMTRRKQLNTPNCAHEQCVPTCEGGNWSCDWSKPIWPKNPCAAWRPPSAITVRRLQ